MKILNRYVHFKKMNMKTFVTYYYIDKEDIIHTDGQAWLLTQDMLGNTDKEFLKTVGTAPVKELWIKNWNYVIVSWGDGKNYTCYIRDCINKEMIKRVEQGLVELIEKGE